MSTGSDGVNWTLFTSGNFDGNYTHTYFGTHEFTPRLTAWGEIQPSPHRRIFFHNNPGNSYTMVWWGWMVTNFTGTMYFTQVTDDDFELWIHPTDFNRPDTEGATRVIQGNNWRPWFYGSYDVTKGTVYHTKMYMGEGGGGDDSVFYWNTTGPASAAGFGHTGGDKRDVWPGTTGTMENFTYLDGTVEDDGKSGNSSWPTSGIPGLSNMTALPSAGDDPTDGDFALWFTTREKAEAYVASLSAGGGGGGVRVNASPLTSIDRNYNSNWVISVDKWDSYRSIGYQGNLDVAPIQAASVIAGGGGFDGSFNVTDASFRTQGDASSNWFSSSHPAQMAFNNDISFVGGQYFKAFGSPIPNNINQIVNGGFESGSGYSITGWTIGTSGPNNDSARILSQNDSAWGGLDSGFGNAFGVLKRSTCYMEQTLTLVQGYTYNITLICSRRPNYDRGDLLIKIAGSTITTLTNLPQNFTAYTSSHFTASATNPILRFESYYTNNDDFAIFMDDIKLNYVSGYDAPLTNNSYQNGSIVSDSDNSAVKLDFLFPSPRTATEYKILPPNETNNYNADYMPNRWCIYGSKSETIDSSLPSTEANGYFLLDSRADANPWSAHDASLISVSGGKKYIIANPGIYSQYRMSILQNSGDPSGNINIGELIYYEGGVGPLVGGGALDGRSDLSGGLAFHGDVSGVIGHSDGSFVTKIFDGSDNSLYKSPIGVFENYDLSAGKEFAVKFELPSKKKILKYDIKNTNIKSWTLRGCDNSAIYDRTDSNTYELLDGISDFIDSSKSCIVSNPKDYTYYVLDVSSTNINDSAELGELIYYDTGSYPSAGGGSLDGSSGDVGGLLIHGDVEGVGGQSDWAALSGGLGAHGDISGILGHNDGSFVSNVYDGSNITVYKSPIEAFDNYDLSAGKEFAIKMDFPSSKKILRYDLNNINLKSWTFRGTDNSANYDRMDSNTYEVLDTKVDFSYVVGSGILNHSNDSIPDTLPSSPNNVSKPEGTWLRVRHQPLGNTTGYPTTDHLAGTWELNHTTMNDSEVWGIKFDHLQFDQFLFFADDYQRWMLIDKDELYTDSTESAGEQRDYTIIQSSHSNSQHTSSFYNRSNTTYDPLVCINDWGGADKCLYMGDSLDVNGSDMLRPWDVYIRLSELSPFVPGTSSTTRIISNPKDYTYYVLDSSASNDISSAEIGELIVYDSKVKLSNSTSVFNGTLSDASDAFISDSGVFSTNSLTSGSEFSVKFEFPSKKYISIYRIWSQITGNTNSPSDWYLHGCDVSSLYDRADESTYNVLDVRTGENSWPVTSASSIDDLSGYNEYTIIDPGNYSYYVLDVSASNNASLCSIGEIAYYESERVDVTTVRDAQPYENHQLAINMGASEETSDWEVGEIIVFNKKLTSEEEEKVINYLENTFYGSDGFEPVGNNSTLRLTRSSLRLPEVYSAMDPSARSIEYFNQSDYNRIVNMNLASINYQDISSIPIKTSDLRNRVLSTDVSFITITGVNKGYTPSSIVKLSDFRGATSGGGGGGGGGGIIGGVETIYGNYKVNSFINVGTSTVTVTGSITVDMLIVGGGAGGYPGGSGAWEGGGGGAGELIFIKDLIMSAGVYTIIVGAGGGGLSGESTSSGANGNITQITGEGLNNNNGYIANGGGTGTRGGGTAQNGGSGGGSGHGTSGGSKVGKARSGTSGISHELDSGESGNPDRDRLTLSTNIVNEEGHFAYSGGYKSSSNIGGGGGGAGQHGAIGSSTSPGGDGKQYDIRTGSVEWYAGGGGGGARTGVDVPGGQGGGGYGGSTSGGGPEPGGPGTANTGGGGGGSVHNGGDNIAGNGGSGILVIRY